LDLFLPPPNSNESIAVPSVVLINFGSPRVGNFPFAKYASQQLLSPFHHRITHHRDIVPHFPLSSGYTHIDGEWYEDEDHRIHHCKGYEDRHCADQWIFFLSDKDHTRYLNLPVSCAAVS
jgi:hypothetical protein